MPRLAVIILTKNEEANIEGAMESAAFADEIVIIDSGSTDRTKELAEKHGAKFVSHPMDEEGFAGQRNFALTQTEADWVFYLDADERVIPERIGAIKAIVQGNVKVAYCVERINVVFGQMMSKGGHRPDYVCRLMPRENVRWRGVVHEGVDTELQIKQIKSCLYHYTYTTWEQYFCKFNRYTTLAAQEMAGKGREISSMSVVGHSLGAFIKNFVFKQGFRDGFLGFIMSFMSATYVLVKYLKLKNIYRRAGK